MLGFNALSENSISGFIADLIALESSSTLNSFSLISGDGFIKFFQDSINEVTSELNGFLVNKNLSTADLYIISQLEESSKVKIPSNQIFAGNSSFDLSLTSRVTANKDFDIFSSVALDSYIKAKFDIGLNGFSNFQSVGTIRLFNSVDFTRRFNLQSQPAIKVPGLFIAENQADLLTNVSTRVLGHIISQSYVNIVDPQNLIKTYLSLNLDIDSDISSDFANLSFNSVDLEIIGVLSANLSQINRDIVYYILAIEKNKPLELKILRAK